MADKKDIKEEIKEEVKEAAKEEVKEEAAAVAEEATETAAAAEAKLLTSTENKRKKKAERRDAKAARKEANKIEEKKSRPNNILIAILIFGVVIVMFGFSWGYNYFSKPASLEKYIEDNGGEDAYGSLYLDEHTTGSLTSEGNSMKLEITCTPEEEEADEFKEYYTSEEGEEYLKYMGAYFLTTMKPEVRGFGGDVTITFTLNDEELMNTTMTYKEAKDFLEELQEEAEKEAAEEAADDAEDTADDAEDDEVEVEVEEDAEDAE